MVLSGISCFFLWFGTSESMMIFMLCLYNGLSISAWNSLDVVTAELYPTDRRLGVHSLHAEVLLFRFCGRRDGGWRRWSCQVGDHREGS